MHEEKGSGGSATMEMLSPTTKGRAAQSSCGNVRQRLCCTRTPSLLTQRIREAVEANATMLPRICKVSTMLQNAARKHQYHHHSHRNKKHKQSHKCLHATKTLLHSIPAATTQRTARIEEDAHTNATLRSSPTPTESKHRITPLGMHMQGRHYINHLHTAAWSKNGSKEGGGI